MRQKAFTLVELMIAVALMVILTGSIVFVFTQAQRIYTQTSSMVKVYQNARAAFDIMERDFANMIRTLDMEFWGPDEEDSLAKSFNGHLDRKSELGNHMFSQGDQTVKNLRLFTQSEASFLFGPVIAQGSYRDKSPGGGNIERAADTIYFKTETNIPGQGTKIALVRYGLDVDPRFRRPPILMKWVAWLEKSVDANGKVTYNVRYESPQPLCYYVTEFRVEFFVKNRRTNGAGVFCRAGEFVPGVFGGDKTKISFVPGQKITVDSTIQHEYTQFFMPLYMNLFDNGNQTTISYSDLGSAYQNSFKGVIVKPVTGEPYFTFSGATTNLWDFFYQLGKGDKIFLFGSQLDSSKRHYYVRPGEYTIKDIRQDPNSKQYQIFFLEPIDTSQMDKDGASQAEVCYRAVWIPSAIRITMQIIDKYGIGERQISRTISRVFRILGS